MFFADEQLGPKQSLLPSGTLWCRDVVVGRTGIQLYAPHEIGVDGDAADRNGMVRVQRDASEVWRAVSLGYQAAYVADGPGRYRQTGIRGNHLAILVRRSRRDVATPA